MFRCSLLCLALLAVGCDRAVQSGQVAAKPVVEESKSQETSVALAQVDSLKAETTRLMAQITELKATVAGLEAKLSDSDAKLEEAKKEIPPKQTVAQLRRNAAKKQWVVDMEDFVLVRAGASEEVLRTAKKLQDKCELIKEQITKVDRGEQVVVDDFTEEEIDYGNSWPLAYSITILEWKLHKNIPLR